MRVVPIILIVFGVIFFLGCVQPPAHEQSVQPINPIVQEVLRLELLSLDQNLTIDDLSLLHELTKDNESLHHEEEEAEWMIEHNLAKHAIHSLNAIGIEAVGEDYVCPADSLSHVRPYLDFNEMEKAAHVVEEGAEALPIWIDKVNAAKAKNPSVYSNSDKLIEEMQATIEAFESGNLDAARTHALYLEENGYC